jgi:hypothetical protein
VVPPSRNANDAISVLVLTDAEFPLTRFFIKTKHYGLRGAACQIPGAKLLRQGNFLGEKRQSAEQRNTANE